MCRRCCWMVLLSAWFLAACGPLAVQHDPSAVPITAQELDAVGQQGLEQWIRQMPLDPSMGISTEGERARATLGQPYELFRMRSGSMGALQPGVQLATLITPANQWEFPVLVDGRVRSQMTAAFFEGRWQVIGIGSTTSLQRLIDYQAQHPDLGEARLVEFAPISPRFALFTTNTSEQLLILDPHGFYFEQIGADRTYTVDELIPNIAAAMRWRGGALAP